MLPIFPEYHACTRSSNLESTMSTAVPPEGLPQAAGRLSIMRSICLHSLGEASKDSSVFNLLSISCLREGQADSPSTDFLIQPYPLTSSCHEPAGKHRTQKHDGEVFFPLRSGIRVSTMSRLGKLSPYPFSSSGWSNNSNDIPQISRRESDFNTWAQGIHLGMKILKTGNMRYTCHFG